MTKGTGFKDRLVETAGHVDGMLRRILGSVEVDGRLREAMGYTL